MAMVMENQRPLAPMPPAVVVRAPPPPPPPLPPAPPLQAYNHRCKVCQKGFTCGRALGGHMRAHGDTDDGLTAAADALNDDDDSGPSGGGGARDSSEAGGGTSAAAEAATTTKRMYSLRTNAGRHKNCRVCESCGKEFTPWKSLLDHGRCHCHYDGDRAKDDDEGLSDTVGDVDTDGEDEAEDLALAGGWSKGKRTRRTRVIVAENGSQTEEQQVPDTTTSREEEEDVANCLVMLASSSSSRGGAVQPEAVADDVHQQPSSASKDDEQHDASTSMDDELQRFFVSHPQALSVFPAPDVPRFQFLAPPQVLPPSSAAVVSRAGLFECKACKKVFTSHQALGGHRASHKKVKGCFAAKLESSRTVDDSSAAASFNDNNTKVVVEAIPAAVVDAEPNNGRVDGGSGGGMVNNNAPTAAAATSSAPPEMAAMVMQDEAPSSSSTVSPFKRFFKKHKEKVHECSICHRVFTSGQALGGHKRCHWFMAAAGGDPTAMAKLRQPFLSPDHHVMHAAMCQQFTLGSSPMMYGGAGASDSCLHLNNVPMNLYAAGPDPTPATWQEPPGEFNRMLRLSAPASSLYMPSWPAGQGHATNAADSNMQNTAAATSGHSDLLQQEATAATEDDEADSTSAKRAKISDLKDMNMAGETSPWLQVGIALPSSETNATRDCSSPEG